jgi:alginate O-acetyltransferase complex protein AlgI
MLFCTSSFFQFFVVVFVAYWSMPWPRARVGLLLLASAYFYAVWNTWLAGLVFVSATIDYLVARGIEQADSKRRKKLLLYLSLAINLGVLGYLKYANFFLRSVESAAGAMGLSTTLPVLKVILPIGISFYTFEAISYVVDVYCGRVRAERNLAHFLLFILFFPHLVAGPIVRARDFLPQVSRTKHWNWARTDVGLRLILLGMVKKLAFADRLALYADPVFADPSGFGSGAIWIGAVACLLQIYCDFSGYSDLALGLAHLLGYHLNRNFDRPLATLNLAEFWRRWHISLSSWLRDYVYVPLGGGRGGRWGYQRNVLTVMALAGLWHGAAWNFVLFGVSNGVGLCIHRVFRNWCNARARWRAILDSSHGRVARVGLTFATAVSTFVFFRAPTVTTAMTMFARMFWPTAGAGLPLSYWGLWATGVGVALGHALGTSDRAVRLWTILPRPVQGLAFGGVAAMALMVAPPVDRVFVYFQF